MIYTQLNHSAPDPRTLLVVMFPAGQSPDQWNTPRDNSQIAREAVDSLCCALRVPGLSLMGPCWDVRVERVRGPEPRAFYTPAEMAQRTAQQQS